MRIKICGVTSPEDAVSAEEAGADAVGVVLFSESPRSVGPEQAGEIFDALGPFTTGVCVTATDDAEELDEILALSPSVVQVGADVSLPSTRTRVLRMVSPGETPAEPCDAVVIDASRGKGLPFSREFARQVIATSSLPVILPPLARTDWMWRQGLSAGPVSRTPVWCVPSSGHAGGSYD
jgi:phosphoribosylanthranilate isomerase